MQEWILLVQKKQCSLIGFCDSKRAIWAYPLCPLRLSLLCVIQNPSKLPRVFAPAE